MEKSTLSAESIKSAEASNADLLRIMTRDRVDFDAGAMASVFNEWESRGDDRNALDHSDFSTAATIDFLEACAHEFDLRLENAHIPMKINRDREFIHLTERAVGTRFDKRDDVIEWVRNKTGFGYGEIEKVFDRVFK